MCFVCESFHALFVPRSRRIINGSSVRSAGQLLFKKNRQSTQDGKVIVVVVRCEVKCRVEWSMMCVIQQDRACGTLLFDVQKLEGTRRKTYADPD